MSSREHDGEVHEKALERKLAAEVKTLNARKRFGVSVLLALIATFKLTLGNVTGTQEALWLGALLLAGGIASVDQFLKAAGKG